MSRWHNAKGTVREVSERLVKIIDASMNDALSDAMDPDLYLEAFIARIALQRARTHEQVATTAVRASYCLRRQGDVKTADLIDAVMEGR